MQNNPHDSLPDTLRRQLAQCFGPDALLLTPAQRLSYGYDNSRQFAMPAAVVLPNETAQVLELVRACRRHGMPIIARGRGTNNRSAEHTSDLPSLMRLSYAVFCLTKKKK